jgi:hypothetical protein
MKPESVSKSLRIGFGPYTDASSGWSKLASVDANRREFRLEEPSSIRTNFMPLRFLCPGARRSILSQLALPMSLWPRETRLHCSSGSSLGFAK